MPKRLLIITDEMEVGGTQRQIVELARHIDRNTFSLSLLYFRNGSPYVDELHKAGVEVTCIPKRWKLDPLFFIRLCRFLRKGDFDLIHGFSFTAEAWGWLANLVSGNACFIGSVRSVYEWFSPMHWAVKRLITLNSSALIANSHAGADHAAYMMGIRRHAVDVVHNVIRVPELGSADALPRHERGNTPGRIVFVGRLVDHKNLHCLLKAFALLGERNATAQLDLVGEGPKRAELEALASQLGIESRVTFHGEQADVGPFLANADVYVSTSYREGLSNATMEAMSAELPVVTSNVGGNSELVTHEHSGMLFPSDDHETLASMLLELLADEGKRKTMGRNAREAMQRFHDPRRMAGEMEHIYERCLVEDKAFVLGR